MTTLLLTLAGAGLLAAAGLFTIVCSVTGIRRQVEHGEAFTEPHRP